MSLFSKLFKKDEKENDGNKNDSSIQVQDKTRIETSFATFTPMAHEYSIKDCM